MGSVSLEDWSLIWDRTNRWIQLKGIDGEFEIESSPVESALGPFIVQTGNTVYNLGKPSKNAFDWIVPKDIREEFSKGFPEEWVVKITALQERRVTRHTPKREGPIRAKDSIISKTNRISKKLEDVLYRGMTEKQKERARKLDRLRALQQSESFKAAESPEVPSRSKKTDEKVKKPPKKAPKRVAARKNSAKIIVSKEKKKIEEKNSSENVSEKPKKRKASTKKEKTDPKIAKAPKRKRNRKEAENGEEEKEEEPSPPKKALVKNSKKTASKKAPKAPKKTPIKAAKEAEILSPDRSASKIPSAPVNGLPTPTFKNEKNKTTKKAKNKGPTQKDQRAHLQRVDELNRVEQQVITPVRKPKSFKPASVTCEAEQDLFSSPKNKENENHDPFSTPAANRRQNDGFATPAAGAFATPAASSSAGSPSACRFATPGIEMDFNTSKKFSKTPSGNISKKKLASRVKANDFVKKQMVENNLETDLFESKKGRKRSKLSKKERIEMSALMPVQENEKDEDETDEYF